MHDVSKPLKPAQHPDRNQTISGVVLVLLCATIAYFLLRRISEYDIWFHLTLGRDILTKGAVPAANTFTLLDNGRPLIDSQWFFQVLAASGYHVLGFWWLHILQFFFWGATFWFVYRASKAWTPSQPLASLLLLIAVIASEERFTVRPELVTVLMVSFFYLRLLHKQHQTGRDIALLVILQVIWTNSHGVFVIGPFLAGCYLLEALIHGIRGHGYTRVRSLGILTSLLAAACLVTPYGLDSLRFAWLIASQVTPEGPSFFKSVYELKSPLGDSSRKTIAFWFYLTLIVSFLITLVALALTRRREIPLARSAIVATLLAISLTGIRNMPLFAIVAAPIIAEYLSLLGASRHRRLCGALITAMLGTATLVWSPRPAFNHLVTWVPYRFGVGISPDYIPVGLPRYLNMIGFSGPIFNSQTLGGFYAFHGYPARLPFYDGRLESYDPQELEQVASVAANASSRPDDWNGLLDRYGFQGLLLEHGSSEASGLLPLIASGSDWRLVYLDQAASFWLRTRRANLPPEVDESIISGLVNQVQNYVQAENLDFFLDKYTRYPDLRLVLLERANSRWGTAYFTRNLGLLQLNMGKLGAAEMTFQGLLKRYPKSLKTLTTLSQIALLRGDIKSAEEYMNRAVRYYPNDPELRENLALIRKAASR